MFYPKCPRCGGAVKSAQSEDVTNGHRRSGMWLRAQAIAGHPHPLMKAIYLGALAGNAIYRRYPGGGPKVCTKCGHRFN